LYAGDGGYCGWNVYKGAYTTFDQGGVIYYPYPVSNPQDISPALFEPIEFIAPTIPSGDQTEMLLGGYFLHTFNFTTMTWTSAGIPPSPYGVIDAIGATSLDNLRIYTGQTDGTVTMTDDGGVKDFYEIDGFNFRLNPVLPQGAVVSAISVSPKNKNKLLVGYANTGIDHLYYGDLTQFVLPPVTTTPQDANWVDVGQGLPDSPLTAIVRDPNKPDSTWYVAMDAGVFMTTNSGNSWVNITGNLPNVTINDLKYGAGYLYVGTFGRGIWRIAVS
jgi:hypothetical protein